MNNQEVLETISKKLGILIALHLESSDSNGVKENVSKLVRFGLSTGEIAEILGTTPGTVAVAKNRLKQRKA